MRARHAVSGRLVDGKPAVRYEDAAPLAVALAVSADLLVFDKGERGPDADLKLELEALSQFDPEEKAIAKKVLQGLIIQHQAKCWTSVASG